MNVNIKECNCKDFFILVFVIFKLYLYDFNVAPIKGNKTLQLIIF